MKTLINLWPPPAKNPTKIYLPPNRKMRGAAMNLKSARGKGHLSLTSDPTKIMMV